MIFERIVRGAVRTQTYLSLKARRYAQSVARAYKSKDLQQSVAVVALVSRLATSAVPTHAPIQRALAASEDAEPSPHIAAAAAEHAPAYSVTLRVASTAETIVSVVDTQLNSVAVGKSYATIKDEDLERQRQEQIRLEQEAKQQKEEAARQAKIAAQRAAEAAARVQQQAVVAYDQSQSDIIDIIRRAAAKYGVDAELMIRIARAESGFNPAARNRSSAATGLFQFMPSTYANSPQAREGKSILDPVANAEAAAYKLSVPGGDRAWNASRYAWAR